MEMPYGKWGNSDNKICTCKFLTQEETKDIIDTALKRFGNNNKYYKVMNL